jgi:hypothetical protein
MPPANSIIRQRLKKSLYLLYKPLLISPQQLSELLYVGFDVKLASNRDRCAQVLLGHLCKLLEHETREVIV